MGGEVARSRAAGVVWDAVGPGMLAGRRLMGPLQGCEGSVNSLMCSQEKGGRLTLHQLKESRYFLTQSHGLLVRW